MDINVLIGRRLHALRNTQGWSLEALAERSKVSRSNISLIERGQSSPTAAVLDKLATALNVTLASLFEWESAPSAEPSPLARADEQPIWQDPESGYRRRNLSSGAASPLQLVEVNFPPGQRVAYETGKREALIHQQIWLIEGAMNITVGERRWQLQAGDCLAMRLDCPIVYHNPTGRAARYLVALATFAQGEPRRFR